MPRQIVPDEKLIPMIKAGYNDADIVKYFGRKPGSLYGPLKRLRKELGIPTPGRTKVMINPWGRKEPTEQEKGTGVTTYRLPKEEIWERYGPPGLCATEKHCGEYQAEDYLIEQARGRKEAAKCQKKK